MPATEPLATLTLTMTMLFLLLPEGEGAGGEGALDVDEALVVAAAETEGYVTLGLDEWAIDKDVEFTDNIKKVGICHDLLPCVSSKAPDVVSEFLLDAVDECTSAFGLLQGVTARERDRSLVIGDDLHQFVECALLAAIKIPGCLIVASRAMMVTSRHID